MSVHILGIRHHGPGSARNVRSFLEELKPDIVLVEGPPEADEILQWVVHNELKPPVAILCYQPDDPKSSVFYPFSEFSPEWQAIRFAKLNQVPVRFFDLPCAQQFALEKEKREKEIKENEPMEEENTEELTGTINLNDPVTESDEQLDVKTDPISFLAEAAGYHDGEKWWEQMFEYRNNCEQVFEAVSEAMTALRSVLKIKEDKRELLREAHMRKMIRQAEKEMYSTIAVVCGAWHVPALLDKHSQKEDNELLKGLAKVKVECTWIPWTYNRLSYYSGYGAGIHSPGWYEHIWHHPDDDGTRWMSKVAQLFRKNDKDTSVAHVIEAVRLAAALASLRQIPKAGLEELNEASLSVLCHGEPMMLRLIDEELIVSSRIGEVPLDIPKPPLQVDIEKLQKSLRFPPTADFKDYTLDLRKENDLARSIFLHRLRLLGIHWGQPSHISGKGTFKEQWRLQWDPAFSIDIIEKGSWGNTVEEASNQYIIHEAQQAKSLLTVSNFLQEALPAELHKAVEVLILQVNRLAAASGDVAQLMEAVPPLVQISRYGNVRKTDSDLVLDIVSSLSARVCIGLPNAVTGISEDAAQELQENISEFHDALVLLQDEDTSIQWQQALIVIVNNEHVAPVISGYATRLLTDLKVMQGEALVRAFSFRMSSANAPGVSAAWLEGFLKGSGTILLVDEDLWGLVNSWISQLDTISFNEVLPLLRRSVANFSSPERRKLGEKVKSGKSGSVITVVSETDIDPERAKKGIPVVLQMLGYDNLALE